MRLTRSVPLAAAMALLAAAPATADWVPVRAWEVPGPESIAVGADGSVFMGTAVGGGDNDGVVRYSPTGRQLARFGVTGRDPGQFDTPWGLGVDRERGQLVVTDIAARAQTFTLDGALLGSGDLTIGGRRTIAIDVDVDPAGDRWFAADGILRASADGTPLAAFGAEGGGPGQLQDPGGVASDGRGNVYVADTGNHRVQRFTPGGKLVDAVAVPRDVGVARPWDLDVAPNGDLVVLDKPRGSSGTLHVLRERPARLASSTLRRGARLPVRVRCTVATTCRGTVTIAGVGRAAYRVAAGRTTTVRVKPTARGRARLASAKRLRVTVTPRSGAGETRRLRIRG